MLRILIAFVIVVASHLTFANPEVILETSKGNITIELFEKEAPETVKNFLSYVDSGFYNGTIFHRVIPDFVIQGGGFSKNLALKETREPIKNEARESLRNLRGTLSMARLSAPHSATSQFFINLKDNTTLDYRKHNMGYAVFGKVDDRGMQVVEQISYSATGTAGMMKDVPVEPVEIIKAYRVKPQAAVTNQEEPAGE